MVSFEFPPTSWAYVKAYQYWCEYLKGNHAFVMLFHLFRCNQGTQVRSRGREFVLLVPMIWGFEDFLELPAFVDPFFFFYPFHSRTHVTICEVESRMEGKCKPLFSHCWSEKQFLFGNDSYVYEHSEFFSKGFFFRKRICWVSLTAWVIPGV